MEAQMEHYLDNSATTQVLRPVAEKALELMVQEYGNPSSLHTKGFQARKQLEEARAWWPGAGRPAGGGRLYQRRHRIQQLAIFGAVQARRRLGIDRHHRGGARLCAEPLPGAGETGF